MDVGISLLLIRMLGKFNSIHPFVEVLDTCFMTLPKVLVKECYTPC